MREGKLIVRDPNELEESFVVPKSFRKRIYYEEISKKKFFIEELRETFKSSYNYQKFYD